MRTVLPGLLTLFLATGAQADLFGGLRNLNLGDIGRVVDSATKAFTEVSPQQERTIGREAAAVVLGAAPPVKDERLQRYVNRVGRWVALQSERPDLDWRFGVLDTPDINAFAAPGGFVFITKGLLLRMGSEAELAGVLAHEVAHVIRRHHLEAVQKNAQLDLAATVVGQAVEQGQRDTLNRITGGFKELYARGLDKDDEFEADRMGIVLATRAGYDPYGLPASLQTLAAINPADSSLAFMFKTHPAPGQRLDRLDGAYDPLQAHATQPAVQDRFRKEVAAARQRGSLDSGGPALGLATDAAAALYLASHRHHAAP